ncbi:hypothetical protein [Candidatus Leptofilum sp.]|uniref:hypothetical protein n=1 Tax=Candidatus Leptofilum sp. TaxID=3241576 RepID=UPI003B5A2229
MMRKIRRAFALSIFFLGALALFVFTSQPAAAQTNAPGVWSSAINLQNTTTSPATVVITFYDTSGNVVTTYTPETLAGGEALSIFVPSITTSPALPSGQYSVVVSSDVQILASVNTASTSSTSAPWTAFAYDGFDSSQAGTSLYFPGNYNNYFNFFSELVIQNTDPSTTANLKATFRDQSGSVIASDVSLGSVAPNAARTVAMSSVAGLPSGSSGIFGAVVTSDENVNLVGVANIWRTTPTAGTASYSGFTSGSTELYAPSLLNNYFGFNSAITIQNVHSTDNAIGTLTYSDGTIENFNLVPGAAIDYFQPNNPSLPSGNSNGLLAAEVQVTQGSVVGLVSQSVPSGTGSFASYNVPASAASSVNIPSVLSDYYGYFSAVTVQNTGSTSTNVTIDYANGDSRTINNVAAGATVNFIHLDNASDVLPFRTATSATVSSSNGNPLVAVIQHNTSPNVAGYNSAKTPSDYLLAVTGVAE